MPKIKDKTISSIQKKKVQKNLKNVEKCSVPGCTNTYSKDGKKTLFFKFPLENERVLQKWLKNINLANWKPLKSSRICSDHFENYNISNKNNVYEVDKFAIPSVNPKIPYCVINSETKRKKKVENEYLIEKHPEKKTNLTSIKKPKLTEKKANKDFSGIHDSMNNMKKLKLEIPKLNDKLFTALYKKKNEERPTDGNIEQLIEKHTTNNVEIQKSKTIKGVKKNEYISAVSPDLFDMTTPKIKNKQYIAIENICELKKLPTKATRIKVIKNIIEKPCPKSKKINFQSKLYSSPRKCPGCKRLCSCNFK